jgi:hypothetical protein
MGIKEKRAYTHTHAFLHTNSAYGDATVDVLRCTRGDRRAPSVLGRYDSHCIIVTWLKFEE